MDIRIQDMDCIEATQKIKTGNSVPVIGVTS